MTVRKMTTIGSMLFLGAIAVPVLGQNNGGGGGGGGGMNGGGGGGGGGGGRQQFMQRMMDNLKDQLGASDDEFAAMQPKIEKVFQLQRETQGQGMRALFGGRGGGGGRGGRGGNNGGGGNGGGPGGDQPATPMAAATAALKDTLDNKDSKPDDIKAKLDAYRAAKAQAKDEMTKAQEDLKGVLTQRQEAVMVELGLLD